MGLLEQRGGEYTREMHYVLQAFTGARSENVSLFPGVERIITATHARVPADDATWAHRLHG